MKKVRYIIVWLPVLWWAVALQAQETEVKAAEEAYAAGEFIAAAEKYEALLLTYGESPQIRYNLGNAYYKAGKIAPAILHYERALLLNPGDADIRFNLQLAREKVIDRIEPVGQFFLVRWYLSVQDMGKADAWAKAGIGAFLLFVGCMALFVFAGRVALKKLGFYTGLGLLAIVAVTNIFARNQKNKLLQRNSAIVFAPTVTVKSSPDASGTDLFVLHEGTKVTVRSTLGRWSEIELADGNIGWMQGKDFEVI
ncbi:MAG: tetratricopeptide repeat protein [Tannerellaceae bacterium]|jgi:tetratricopeptide (TPR) repeat protein|nr:tetratricopeptide repeat protein [Tannerellaceae bacterium]